MIIMDGPAHNSNRPTLTFGCRGIATCDITTYGAKLPMHSGHYGNYAPNPVFELSRILATLKDEDGRVLVKDYYEGKSMIQNGDTIHLNNIEIRADIFVRLNGKASKKNEKDVKC